MSQRVEIVSNLQVIYHKSVEEVRQILHAIEQRDPEKAAAACREHVQNAAKAALSGLTHQQNGKQQEMTELEV